MKLSVADVDKMMADAIPRARNLAAEDYEQKNRARQLEIIEGFAQQQSQAAARIGEILPPPPRSLKTEVDSANDFGITVPEGDTSADPATPAVLGTPIPRALAGVDLDHVMSRATLIFGLTQNLPMNELGLPKILYRPDVLDWMSFQKGGDYDQMQAYLDAATLHLSYVEGFPALPTGEPLWAKMPFEGPDAYEAFTQYCTLAGARQTSKLIHIPHERVLDWFHTNYWLVRSKCYDMLSNIHAAKVREQRILACEDNHYLEADRILGQMKGMMDDVDWGQLKSDPKAFVEVMEKAIKLQKMALNMQLTDKRNEQIKSESVEVQMKRLVSGDSEAIKTVDDSAAVREILKNPGALASAQELIIRLTRSSQQTSTPVSEE